MYVKNMMSAMDDYKYMKLETLALQLLSILANKAVRKRVSSLVRRIKMNFRSRLIPEIISAFVGIHFNSLQKCCEGSYFDASFLCKQSPVVMRGI